MKSLCFIAVLSMLASCNTPFVIATFRNKNVYKTKAALPVKMAYDDVNARPSNDQRDFFLIPNGVITKTTTTNITLTSAPFTTFPTVTTTTIPPGTTTTSYPPVAATANADNATTTTITPPAAPIATNHFIRYKVVSEEGDFKYIRVLPGCQFDAGQPTHIIYGSPATGTTNPSDYIFQVSKKDLTPNTHYLASSALIGKIITLPMRVRNEYWDNDNKVLQGTFALNYGFGWKYKFGNNPYRSSYLSTILYSAGVTAQKHFSIANNVPSDKKDEFALTYLSFGIAYEIEKFNVGIFAGKDKMFGNLKNWAYQDEWWWGVGIGYDLFK